MRAQAAVLLGLSLVLGATPALATPNTARGEARLSKLVAGRVAGKPVDCINLNEIRSTEIVDDTAIVYRAGRRLYVNRPASGASSLDRDDILLTRTSLPQLCSVDIVRLIDRAGYFPAGSVGLGEFIPYTLPDRD